jgi:uncharacterized protein YecE (DUF72 family)
MPRRAGPVRIGVGGWSYAPWRDNFYPKGLKQSDELAYAARHLSSIEINGTFYRTQSPPVFRAWREAVPQGFVFAVKASRAAAQRTDPDDAAPSIERFLGSGLTELGEALGPILWQLPPTRRFDAGVLQRFLDLLPESRDGIALRHALEARHESFASPEALALLRARNVAQVIVDNEPSGPVLPREAHLTADFVYARLQRSQDEEPLGYPEAALDEWAGQLRGWSAERSVFAYVIAGAKHRAPAAAMALIARQG